MGQRPLTDFATMKARALLIYLAMIPGPHSRDELAHLLWSDMPDRQAKKNLRNTLPNLKALVGPHLMITRHALALNRDHACEVDVEQFCAALNAPQTSTDLEGLRDATALYRDDFLSGFYVREAHAFEDWGTIEREHLRTIAIEGLLTLVEHALEQGVYELGLEATRRLLTLDPWRETAHQHRMRLLAYTGQRGAALAQYETCRQVMLEELGVEPLADTTELYEQIKEGSLPLPPPKAMMVSSPRGSVDVDWSDFPKRAPFYGRGDELATLRHWLLEEQACLVGLFGIGGQGKSALAAEVAWSLIDEPYTKPKPHGSSLANGAFDRILWRSLVNAPPFETMVSGWLAFLTGDETARAQGHIDDQLSALFEHLRQQRCLLVLDDVDRILRPESETHPVDKGYEQLIEQMGQRVHRSSLLLVSRDCPKVLDTEEASATDMRRLQLRGLTVEAGLQLIQLYGLDVASEAADLLIERYSGHPLALKLVIQAAQTFFADDPGAFFADLTDNLLILDDLRHVIDQQLAVLLPLERSLLIRLAATGCEPVTFQTLWGSFGGDQPLLKSAVLEALSRLRRWSLLETSDRGFSLQPIMTAYVKQYLQESPDKGAPEALSP
ncbi:MAG: hypothetical protein ETSY2_24180 [Candidatus Entotheonella gemina]|uniref:Bacterial transcriptional activator domain-containing protein n=1 Tax=Candidatus Entotheonella gemina TaxID=1429439 RepID=W4M4V4_9BACT|nr:MAG: hypothetical protein ETSY2_24180 [Candidatus Entotheonella gemina]